MNVLCGGGRGKHTTATVCNGKLSLTNLLELPEYVNKLLEKRKTALSIYFEFQQAFVVNRLLHKKQTNHWMRKF